MKQENLFGTENEKEDSGPVECLGMTFESDEARRTHFTDLLREKLKDPEFRAIEGFPIGTDEAILELSDPPYYTACPNPFLIDVIDFYGKEYSESTQYKREPFASNVSVGKNHPIYSAHSYHTKVPHEAIVDYILHYTDPGDLVLDGFSGSGMTGLAANMCGNESIAKEVRGERYCILNDLSPLSGHISYNNNNPLYIPKINEIYDLYLKEKFDEIEREFYQLSDGTMTNYLIWSDCYLCPECGHEYNYWEAAVNQSAGEAKKKFPCPSCQSEQNTRKLTRVYETKYDQLLGDSVRMFKQTPVRLSYFNSTRKREQRNITSAEKSYSREFELSSYSLQCFPVEPFIKGDRWKRDAFDNKGITHVHHFYTTRAIEVLSRMLLELEKLPLSFREKSALKFVFTSFADRNATKRNRFVINKHNPKGRVNGPMANCLYAPNLFCEMNLVNLFREKLSDIASGFESVATKKKTSFIQNSSSSSFSYIKDNSIDYIFTDPPFGHNIQYSELNLPLESFLKVRSESDGDIVVNETIGKGYFDYTSLISMVFSEYYRVLKPSRWITVEFHNSKASVWNAIQEAMSKAGFVIANVATLDKKQKTIHQDFNISGTVDKDLIISAYKPSHDILVSVENERFDTWKFLTNHLSNLPSFIKNDSELLIDQSRLARSLYDTLVAYCIQSLIPVRLSYRELLDGLQSRFVERDDMFFLPEQVSGYDKARALSPKLKQLSIFVDDERSAIHWIHQQLSSKPKTYQEIHPLFINELNGWKREELNLELSTLLEQNFIKYDGKEDVPPQIHTYLSTNFKDMRGLDKSDPKLVAKAKDRWYVPDPNKAADLEKVRLRALLKEFETYKAEKKKIKQPRAEALRAGFNTAWEVQDFQTILDISAKIPPAVLQEDEKLLMFYDNALTLTSTEDDEW